MHAVQLIGHGGIDQLAYRTDIPVPSPAKDEVLIKVTAAGINNTDINTRIGWYSKAVTTDTETGGADGFDTVNDDDASWSGIPLTFPRIQGADVCGEIVAVGADIDPARIGQRVLVQSIQPVRDAAPYTCITFGSECDGGFAQFTVAKSEFTHAVNCDWTDAELASLPCAYSTAENMLHRAGIGAGCGDMEGETVLITGASGGVGSAAVQLAKRRGAHVIAMCSPAKTTEVTALGADQVIDRNADLIAELGRDSVDFVIDLVAGPQWPSLLEVLRRGGRYATAGAIAGPITELDVRTLYLKDLTLFGSTFQADEVFPNLISYVERGEIRPTLAATYPLANIAGAQEDFLTKKHTGKLVLIPPHPDH
jgi:NADPH:quinone reductase-like Zn-dependent oxidoreductase